MKDLRLLISAVLGLAALLPGPARAETPLQGDGVSIRRSTAKTAGRLLSAGSFAMNTTVGDVGGNATSGGSFRFSSGMQNVAAQPGSVVSITAVTKSTGTLDLSWNAPGADGFLGGVINGFYRVDYSADANHVFSPLTYQMEFSTTVSANSPQTLQIQGLIPNTTYYTRIYLADARKYFAEDSKRSDESTLANAPVNPVLAGVFSSSVTITWLLPSLGAEGFAANASSTNFGQLLPGGAVVTSTTSSGVEVSLTIDGLNPETTYFFKVASLNWQGDKNFSVIIGTVTGKGPPIFNLAANPNALGRTVSMTWSNHPYTGFDQVLVLVSTSPTSPPVVNGQSYSVGQVLSDSSVVKSTAVATALTDAGLILDQSYYYSFYSRGSGAKYSVSVSTSIFLDLPPMAPGALSTLVSDDHSTVILKWKQVASNLDGSSFKNSTTPIAVELARYDIFRATNPLSPSWVKISSLPVSGNVYVDNVPDPSVNWAYKVAAVDSLETSELSMAQDISNNLYVYSSSDTVTALKVPASLLPDLRGTTNGLGFDIIVRAKDLPHEVGTSEKVLRSVRFDAYKIPGNELVPDFQFTNAESIVSLHYAVSNGKVVPMSSLEMPLDIPAGEAANNLTMYWNPNGTRYRKLFGKVDTLNQTVSVQSPFMGEYQIRSIEKSTSFNFDVSGLSNKVITPNGDGLNDAATFLLENPKDSSFSGQIFDVTGALVSEMAPGPNPDTLQWNGKANGRAVPGGVYIYQIRSEGKAFNGTLMVIR